MLILVLVQFVQHQQLGEIFMSQVFFRLSYAGELHRETISDRSDAIRRKVAAAGLVLAHASAVCSCGVLICSVGIASACSIGTAASLEVVPDRASLLCASVCGDGALNPAAETPWLALACTTHVHRGFVCLRGDALCDVRAPQWHCICVQVMSQHDAPDILRSSGPC